MSGRSSEKKNGRAAAGGESDRSAAWQGFVDIDLTLEDKERVREMSLEAEDVLAIVFYFPAEGYKLTISHDAAHSSYVAAATCQVKSDPNAGYTLNGRGAIPEKALNSLWYKHSVIAQAGAWSNVASGRVTDDVG
jgi:hypothetical protein